MNIIFDIESEGLDTAEQLVRFEPKFSPDSRLKDPEKISFDIATKQEEWLSKAALDAGRARVLVIGIMREDEFLPIEMEETSMLKEFWRIFSENTGCIFIGHNVKGWDLPFMVRRSFILGVKPPAGLFDGRYLSRRIIDTMEAWGCGEYQSRISLDNLARALGVGKKSGSGKDFAELYKNDHVAAMLYLKNDLTLTAKCAEKMGIL